jgi:hypothetical protein
MSSQEKLKSVNRDTTNAATEPLGIQAREPWSVGLHFTEDLFCILTENNISTKRIPNSSERLEILITLINNEESTAPRLGWYKPQSGRDHLATFTPFTLPGYPNQATHPPMFLALPTALSRADIEDKNTHQTEFSSITQEPVNIALAMTVLAAHEHPALQEQLRRGCDEQDQDLIAQQHTDPVLSVLLAGTQRKSGLVVPLLKHLGGTDSPTVAQVTHAHGFNDVSAIQAAAKQSASGMLAGMQSSPFIFAPGINPEGLSNIFYKTGLPARSSMTAEIMIDGRSTVPVPLPAVDRGNVSGAVRAIGSAMLLKPSQIKKVPDMLRIEGTESPMPHVISKILAD